MDGLNSNLQHYLSAGSLIAYPAAFFAGLLISFTPCVYPVIPIQLSFIGGQTAASRTAGQGASLRGFGLSLLFVVGMASVYAGLGAFAALTGTLFGQWASSPWAYLLIGNVVFLLALSMFDIIQLPTLQFLTKWTPEPSRTSYVSALLLGASSGLIVGPCTAPALGAALAFVGARGNVIFGTTVLFVLAMGMGALMIALGTFSGALTALPRSGAWMVKVKKTFGIIMILVAEYLLIQAGQRFI
ncbi:MAG: sulfite exporter TauE/SafE family protein [Acidobacteria bacterium]|nr:sulfite exporter TauE/SafE family protein [Acidobacteriota bacterium]